MNTILSFCRGASAVTVLVAVGFFLSFPAPAVHAETLGPNLIKNPSFQTGSTNPSNWSRNYWGSLQAKFTYPAVGRNNTKAAKIQVSGYSSGDAKWTYAPVPVTGGATYIYSDYTKTTVATELVAEYKLSNGSVEYRWLAEFPASSAWKKNTARFTIPSGVEKAAVYHIIEKNGSLTIDDVSLRKVEGTGGGTTPPPPPPPPQATGKGLVSVTFDDGWKSQYTSAVPIMDKYGIKGTFYMTTMYLDSSYYTGFMTANNLVALNRAGHEIGGHTVTHPHLPQLASPELNDELIESKKTLEDLLGTSVTSLAYPFGDYNETVQSAAKNAGYTSGRTVWGALNDKNTPRFELQSLSPRSYTPLSEIKREIDRAQSEDKWVIIAFHEINDNGREYSNTPEYFEEVIKYISDKGIPAVTVSEGLSRIAK